MRAAIYRQYGAPEVVHIGELPYPTPGRQEIRIRVTHTTVSAGDVRLRSANGPRGFGVFVRMMQGVFGPRHPVLGTEIAGVVDTLGSGVTSFAIGDRVFGATGVQLGGHAEFVVLPASAALVKIPPELSDADAVSLVFGGTTALAFLRDIGRIQADERVLVNGASGAVGSAAVQLAVHFGAEVTAVCSARNAEACRALGAAHVIDYTKEDFARGGARYDIVLDTIGNVPWSRGRHALREGGRLLLAVADLAQTLGALLWPRRGGREVRGGVAMGKAEDLALLAELAVQGALEPVVDRTYPLAAIVEAHTYVDTGRKRGNVLVRV